MNIKAEINEIEYRNVAEKVKETESWVFFFFLKIINIDKSLERLKNSKRGNLQINQYQEWNRLSVNILHT